MLSHSKTKWYRALALTVLALNVVCTILFWWTTSGDMAQTGGANLAITLGRLFGFLAQLAILLELILIGRITWLEQLFGHTIGIRASV